MHSILNEDPGRGVPVALAESGHRANVNEGQLILKTKESAARQRNGTEREAPIVNRVALAVRYGGQVMQVATSGRAAEIEKALHSLYLLLRAGRLYDRQHPRMLQSLDQAYDALRRIAGELGGLEVRMEPSGLVVPKLGEAALPDEEGELAALGDDLLRAGIHNLIFSPKFHVGELDILVQLAKATLLRSEGSAKAASSKRWPARLLEYQVEGISVNTHTERKVDTVLASMIAALVAYGGHSPDPAGDTKPIRVPGMGELQDTLRLLARLTPPLEAARGLSPEEAARSIHSAMEEASRDIRRLLLNSISQYPPKEAELPQAYLLRLSEDLICEFLADQFSAGSLTPASVLDTFHRLASVLVNAGRYTGPHSSAHLSSVASIWADDTHREQLLEKFWLTLPPREKSAAFRGPEVWCVPVVALRQILAQLSETGADAARQEARAVVLNYARQLEHSEAGARRSVAAGLTELRAIIEALWPNQLPEDLSRGAIKALEKETLPESAALLAAFLETVGRIAVTRGDFAGFENIVNSLERVPQDQAHEYVSALTRRLVAEDRWLILVDAALANRALDPVLSRLLRRDPERLLDRLTLLLTEPRGAELLPAMARLIRVIGIPVLTLLETRLYEARRQRVSAAIKLLALADSDRLLRGLTRAMASWEWNLQDLAVSELVRPTNAASAKSAAFVFAAILTDAHPLVVPIMIDQIGLSGETAAVPQLMEIAAGEHETLRDQFLRIKAIEALGRMQAREAAELLHSLAEKRDGLIYAEPAGLRAAAEEALALLEDHPSANRVRAAFEVSAYANPPHLVQRRYARVPLPSPLRAQIGGPAAEVARVRTIGLGGAYLEAPKKLKVGDAIKLEVRSGLRKIQFTAVVRNIGADGNGVEFVHMRDEDRERLRKLVQRHLPL